MRWRPERRRNKRNSILAGKCLLKVGRKRHRMQPQQIPGILGGSSSVWQQEEAAGMGKVRAPLCFPQEFWRKALAHQHRQWAKLVPAQVPALLKIPFHQSSAVPIPTSLMGKKQECISCIPQLHFQADGTNQEVTPSSVLPKIFPTTPAEPVQVNSREEETKATPPALLFHRDFKPEEQKLGHFPPVAVSHYHKHSVPRLWDSSEQS